MDEMYWIQLLVEIFMNLVITGGFVIYIRKIIDTRFERKEKNNEFLTLILKETKDYVCILKKQCIQIQCLTDENGNKIDLSTSLKRFFIKAGDFQIYIEDNKNLMKEFNKKKNKDIFQIKTIDILINKIMLMGRAMNNSEEEFPGYLKEVIDICNQLINYYNVEFLK